MTDNYEDTSTCNCKLNPNGSLIICSDCQEYKTNDDWGLDINIIDW